MKYLLFLLIVLTLQACSRGHNKNIADATLPARGVVQRVVPELDELLTLELIPSEDGKDYFEVESKNGELIVQANNTISLCRGVYDFLKQDLNCIVLWEGHQLKLPDQLPEVEKRRVVSPHKFRLYLNQVTSSYTTAFWDWERWQQELDWMALHGVNNPLSLNGQEKVWQKVWQQMGLSDEQIREFFGGPAYLPFQRMGCLHDWAGPLPQEFIDKDAELQKKILARQKELDMVPVLPAFNGFVPEQIHDLYPEAQINESSGWCDFPPTNMLEPRDFLFEQISNLFGKEYEKEYGERSGYYLVDLYIEMKPMVNEDTAEEELSDISSNIYKALQSSDPDATWFMQGWMFHFEWEKFWDDNKVSAFIEPVPKDKFVILDLGAEREEIWRTYDAIGEGQFIWGHVHNFGGHTNLFGQLDLIASLPIRAMKDAGLENFKGMGLTMEGLEQNSVVYELMSDMMWQDEPMNLELWIPKFAKSKYRSNDDRVSELWMKIYNKFYTNEGPDQMAWNLSSYEKRPSEKSLLEIEEIALDPEKRALIDQMLDMPEEVRNNTLFQRDLVDVSKGYFQEYLGIIMKDLIGAIASTDADKVKVLHQEFERVIHDIDLLLATIPAHRMDRWIGMARDKVDAEENKDLFERNARMLVTIWGGNLNDYAHKEWSGLLSDYYLGRWNLFFEEYAKTDFSFEAFDQELVHWEHEWVSKTGLITPKDVQTLAQVKKLMDVVHPE